MVRPDPVGYPFAFSASQARKAVAEALKAVKPMVNKADRHEQGEEMVLGFGHPSYGFSDCINSLGA